MAKPGEVLSMLCAGIECAIIGDKYENIEWFGKSPAITKEQYEKGFADYDRWATEKAVQKEAARLAILNKLGLTEEEIAVLLG